MKNKLLAGLEFQYGDVILNPLDAISQNRGADLILIRDGDQEGLILELMEQGSFVKTEGGYIMEDEAAEYDFMYNIVPQLEKLLQVYATTAVKARLLNWPYPPEGYLKLNEQRTDWLEFRFDMDGIPESEIRNLLKSVEEKRKYYRLPNGALLPLESEEFQEIVRFMNEVGIRYGDLNGAAIQLPVVRGLHLMDSQNQGNTVKLGKSFRRLLDDMQKSG